MSLKENLSDLLSYMQAQMVGFPDLLSASLRAQSGKADRWSAKDTLVHNLVWADRRLAMLEAALRGETPAQVEYGDFDQANREIFKQYRDTSWEEVLDMARNTYSGAAAYLEEVSEEDLLSVLEGEERTIWRSITDNFLMHPMIHLWEFLRDNGYKEKLEGVFGDKFFKGLLSLDAGNNWQGLVHYNLACIRSLSGELEAAVADLGTALRQNPGLADWSRQDPDLDLLREHPDYLALFEGGSEKSKL